MKKEFYNVKVSDETLKKLKKIKAKTRVPFGAIIGVCITKAHKKILGSEKK